MKIKMPAITNQEIKDGYRFYHEGHIFVAYDVPEDDGHACGYDETDGKDYDLWFVWTMNCWVFTGSSLAEHET